MRAHGRCARTTRLSSRSATTASAAPIRRGSGLARPRRPRRGARRDALGREPAGGGTRVRGRDPDSARGHTLRPVTPPLPTGTVTFLIADIEGSTRLVQDAGADYADILAHRATDPAHGRRRQRWRRGRLQRATSCAPCSPTRSQRSPRRSRRSGSPARALARRGPRARADRAPHRRAGARRGGYFGLDVIRAARVSGAGHGGQILLSAPTARARGRSRAARPRRAPARGLAAPERIYQLLADGLPRDFPPLRNTIAQLGAAVRVVLADDSLLLREGHRSPARGGRVRDRRRSRERPRTCSGTSRCTRRTSPSSTSACPRPTPTRVSAPQREIRERFPETGVLVLSQYVEAGYAFELLAGSAEGVGYLLKDRISDLDEFGAAVRRVADGGSALDPEVVSRLLGRQPPARPARRDLAA